MKTLLISTAVLIALGGVAKAHAADSMSSVVPNAKAGECYAKVLIPAVFRTETSTVVIEEASERVRVVPAQFKWAQEKVLVSKPTTELKVVPAKYGTETHTVEIAPPQSLWVSGSQYSKAAANPGILALAAAGGVDIENATHGQCFQEYYEAPSFEQVTEKVLVSEASYSVKILPATYEWVEQQQVVAASALQMVEVPAVFDTVVEKVKVSDAKVVWKKGRGPMEKLDHGTGEIMCLVEVPAVYKSITKKVLKSAASVRSIAQPAKYETVRVRKLVAPASEQRSEIPARYRDINKQVKKSEGRHLWLNSEDLAVPANASKTRSLICKKEEPAKTSTVSRTVVVTPATVQKIEVPASYTNKRVRQLVSAAQQSRVSIPAVTKEVTKQVKVSDSRLEWLSVLCETNTTSNTVKDIQKALTSAGYEVGFTAGELTPTTLNAIRQYQRANGLPVGALTMDTLSKLGVTPGL